MPDTAEAPVKVNDLTVNGRVSEQLQVKPLNEDEVAIYKLIKSDQDDITRTEETSGKKMKHQQVYSFVGRKRIYDPFAKKRIMIENITSFKHEKLPSGEIKEIPIVGRLKFPRTGEIILTSRDFETMQFMERMNENRDNPFRDASGAKPLFYRVNSKRALVKELEDDYLKVDAMIWIRDSQEIELRAIYKGLDAETKREINADANFEQLKRGLFKVAEKYPILVLKASANKSGKLKVQCLEAEKFRVILFDEGDNSTPRRWLFTGKGAEEICPIEPGVNKYDGILKFFSEDAKGKDWYKKIIDSLTLVLKKR